MADNRRGKDKRYYFSRVQLVLLGGAFTLASVVIFLMGMFVGKGIEERKMAKNEEPSVKIPVKPSAQDSNGAPGAPPKEELTFYDTLTKPPAPQPVIEEKAKEKQPQKVAKVDVKETKAQARPETPPLKAIEKKRENLVPAAEASQRTAIAETAERENSNGWTVQVNAFPDERSAKMWADRLKSKGYKAYVTEVHNKGKLWYRVRVGRYGTREDADKLVETLRSKENFANAFATIR
jgi:cell division septation protein DedD